MKNRLIPVLIFWAALMSLSHVFVAHGQEQGKVHDTEEAAMNTPRAEESVVLEIPLFSPYFADTPVALVNEEPLFLRELVASVATQEEETGGHHEDMIKNYRQVLDRLIRSRLIVQEARNIGLDETEAVQAQITDFKLRTLQRELIQNQLQGLEPDPADVEEVYHQISREVKLYSLTFQPGPDANIFREEVKEGDFTELAEKYIKEGKAEGEPAEQYVKMKDLRPQVAEQVYSMETGDVSIIFRTGDGFLLFQLTDSRFVEDPAVREEAVRIVTESFRKQKAMEYSQTLEEKYVDFNEELYEQLDLDADYKKLRKDDRVLATIKKKEPVTITVGDLISKVEMGLFHGAEKAQSMQKLNKKKDVILANLLFRYTSELEAEHQGLDQTDEFRRKVEEFERSVLFNAFMNRVVLPEVKLTGEEVRSYYDAHMEEFSSPSMLRMNSLVFKERQDAESSLEKLLKGADFNWVSANAAGLVPPDTEGILPFDQNLLSLTALPEDLQQEAVDAKKGDTILYAPSQGDFFYVLLMEDVFPPEPQPYEKVRDEAAKIVFNMKNEKLLDEWTAKLKEAYDTRIFLTHAGD